jgi:ubiquinone/menaquinone biosynthesis C-methylase UbiE
VIASMMRKAGMTDPTGISVLEIGCGAGGNLTEFIRMGLDPARMTGIELVDERLEQARERLPGSVTLIAGDAAQQPVAPESQSIVMLSTVMSSVLDDAFQERLAAVAWAAVKPGGALLWYDFAYNNPRNPDVRGVPFKRVQALFPEATTIKRRVTLAPPIARRVAAVHPFFYTVFNTVPLLRSHLVCWLAKPAG